MKNLKKILASLLVVAMVLTAAPLGGFVGLELPAFDLGIRASAKTVASSGSCGDNVTYTYNSSTGELVISGEGPMTDYGSYSGSPFYNSNIKSVVINDGVTTIGNCVFYDCDSLTSITIPDSVTIIDSYAFSVCSNLSSITIPDSVTTIGYNAFQYCYNLTSITIPDSVTSIGDDAFYYCDSLTSITIPDSVTSIGSSAFYNTAYYNNSSNWENNFLYIGNYLIDSREYLSESYTIKDGTKVIANNAFSGCSNLTSITIPDSVTTIGSNIFGGCSSLETLNIGSGLKEIPANAFQSLTALKTVNLSEGLEKIGNFAFGGCTNLTSITIPDSVTTIGSNIFGGCLSLETLTIGSGLKEIPASYFADMTSLKTVNLSEGLEKIGDYAFSGCTYLETINIPDSVTYIGADILKNTAWFNYRGKGLITIDSWIYGYKGAESNITVNIDKKIKGIADSAFRSNTNIIAFVVDSDNPYYSSENGVLFNKNKTVLIEYPCGKTDSYSYVVPETVKDIKGYAFYDCWNIYEITIGDNVETIGESAFSGCGINSLNINVKSIADNAFSNCSSLNTLTIGDNVETIGDRAFYNCYKIRVVVVGNAIRTIGKSAFGYSTSNYGYSREIYIEDLEAWCRINFTDTTSNPMYNSYYSSNYSYLYINGVEESNIVIPETITEIKSNSFYRCGSIKNVTVPNSVTTIGDYVFYECNNLSTVTIGNSVTTIGDYAFYDCNGITNITLPDTVETIGYRGFSSCDNLTNITLSQNLKSIGDGVFSGCLNLKDVYYPGSQEDWDAIFKGYNYELTNADLFLLHRHNYTVTVTKQPTCTVAGEALYTCVHGDTKTEVIQPLGHTWDEGKITANSTCSKGGTKTYTCTVCFATKSETIETLDHNYQLISSYNPTCTKDGYDVYRCTYCGTTENRTTSPMLGHNFESEFTVDIDSTCTVTGIKSKHCTRCTETAEETVIPLKNHAWQTEPTVTKIPTCTAEGESVVLCRDCKIVKDGSSAVIPALGHDAKNQPFTVDVPATCVSFGKQSRHCTRCNYIEQITRIPMSEHDYYVAEESTATCSKPGIAIYVCSMCKDSYTVENSPALGHDFEYIIIETPTCTREGYEYGDCTRCDATETRPVPTIDHDYIRTEVSPTCLDDGLATYTCSYGCGKTYDEVIPALGHNYPANWVTILPATCTERGSAIKICRACSEVMSQVMPKLSHTDSNSDGVCDECGFGGESKPDTPEEPDAPEEPDTPEVPDTPDIPDEPEEEPCDCDCHAGGIKAFFFNFLNFFAKLFNKDARTCECGAAH